jgi:hypothetical protein
VDTAATLFFIDSYLNEQRCGLPTGSAQRNSGLLYPLGQYLVKVNPGLGYFLEFNCQHF